MKTKDVGTNEIAVNVAQTKLMKPFHKESQPLKQSPIYDWPPSEKICPIYPWDSGQKANPIVNADELSGNYHDDPFEGMESDRFRSKLDAHGETETEASQEEVALSCVSEGEMAEVVDVVSTPVYPELIPSYQAPTSYSNTLAVFNQSETRIYGSPKQPDDEDERGGESFVANYKLEPLRMEQVINWRGDVDYENCLIRVRIRITLRSREICQEFTIFWKEIESLAQVVARRFPMARARKKFYSQIEMEFRESLECIATINCYCDHGWQLIAGKRMYVHQTAKGILGIITTTQNLPATSGVGIQECCGIWEASRSLYRVSGTSAILSVSAFLGVMYRIFDEAGHAPRFLLFLTGKTGSFKTAIGKVLFTQVEEERFREQPRRLDSDTLTSLERSIVTCGRDTTRLIDDFSPALNRQKKATLENALEMITRMVGDGSSRSRSNGSLEDRRGEGVRGFVVVTGELRGKILSSNLRCLYLTIEKEHVNLTHLTWLQENNGMYCALIQHFINYLSDNWEGIVSFVRENFDIMRKKASNILHTGRLADALAILWLATDILAAFFERCGETGRGNLFEQMKRDMISVFLASEAMAYEEDPTVSYMCALETLLENQELNLKTGRFGEEDLEKLDGFEADECLYLMPLRVYLKVKSWIQKGGGSFTLSEKEIVTALGQEGYLVPSSNGKEKRTFYARILIGKNRVNFLRIPRSKLSEFARTEPDFF
ncbi:MAG: hypothetical protein LUE65_03445 [Clostridiales bacterium]|nr:hypothetical protein [Clostridiales bacterium]